MNKIEFIKREFGNYFKDISNVPEGNVQNNNSMYNNRRNHTRSCMYTLVKMLKPTYILEIGSMHYDSANIMAQALDELNIDGYVDSFDIIRGGYDEQGKYPTNKKVHAHFWYPHHTDYDIWKYTNKNIVHSDFKDLTNEKIQFHNSTILDFIKPKNDYDLILIDGDHSYKGVGFDWQYSKISSHDDTIIIFDDLYDSRHWQVKKFFDELNTTKWDFKEWNDYTDYPLMSTGVSYNRKINYE